ncbi:MAG: hypothetical protein ACE5JL_01390 [Dehalococcoidia bacterium]
MAAETDTQRMEAETSETQSQMYTAIFFFLLGLSLILATLILWAVLAVKAGDYYAYDMATRDAAQTGSDILSSQRLLEAYPMWLIPMPFFGIACIFLGIISLFGSIIPRIRLRMTVMATVLPALRGRGAG